jgi:Domain of unknown function (DUF4268)/T5orf172 domain
MPDDKPVRTGGYVYFVTNSRMPGLVKIGITTLTPDERARQLSSSTGVPGRYQVIASQWFEDHEGLKRAERELYAKYREYRLPKSEHFEIDVKPEQAQEELLELSRGLAKGTLAPAAALNKVNFTRTSDTNASVLGLPYWTRFNEIRTEQKLLPCFENAGARFFHRYFLVNPSKRNGRRNIHYEGRIRINPPQVSMRLIFKTADNIKELFDLVAQDRNEIERGIGFPLLWLRDRGRKESHIAVERDDMDPRDATEWERQHAWLSKIVSGFEKVIQPCVAKLMRSL